MNNLVGILALAIEVLLLKKVTLRLIVVQINAVNFGGGNLRAL